jgi:3-hydroxybutyryl-CoA dehydrogenase
MSRSVGIVGAGQMGTGIAHVFALAGYDVLLNDISADALARPLP